MTVVPSFYHWDVNFFVTGMYIFGLFPSVLHHPVVSTILFHTMHVNVMLRYFGHFKSVYSTIL